MPLPPQTKDSPAAVVNLGKSAVSGAVYAAAGQWGKMVLQLTSVAVLSRLLSPAEIGLIAMIVAFTGLAEQCRDLGLSSATIARKDLTTAQNSALFWLNAIFGVGLGMVVALCAPLLAWFYDRPELLMPTLVIALAFPIGGFGVQHFALLQRDLRFKATTVVELGAQTTGLVAGIGSAWLGNGMWALVHMLLATAIARVLFSWMACRWVPGPPRRTDGVRELMRFGAGVSVFNILAYLARSVDNIVVGRFFGPVALGFYSRAYSLLLMPLQQMNMPMAQVAVPILSRLHATDHSRFRQFYLMALRVLCLGALPLPLLMAVVAEPMVQFMLGEQWLEVVPLFRWLAPAGFVAVVGHTAIWLYVSCSNTDRMAAWAAISRPLVVLSFFAGIPWGPHGVAAAFSIGQVLLLPWTIREFTRRTPIHAHEVYRVAAWPAVFATVSAASAWLVLLIMPTDINAVWRFFVPVLVATAAHLGCVAAWGEGRHLVRRIVRAGRSGSLLAAATAAKRHHP